MRAAAATRVTDRLNDELEERWGVRLRFRGRGWNTAGGGDLADPTAGHGFVTGDRDVAARLEQAAGADEISLAEQTYALTRDAHPGRVWSEGSS